MTTPPPLPKDQLKTDADHLNLLSIFHFVAAGLELLALLFLFVHFMFFKVLISHPQIWQNRELEGLPTEFFAVFKWFYGVLGLLFAGMLVLNVLSGWFLRVRKHSMFCLVVAGINCTQIPFGTALGVLTIIVLARPSVRDVYDKPL